MRAGSLKIPFVVATLLAAIAPSAQALVIDFYEPWPIGGTNPNVNRINDSAPAGDRGWSNLPTNNKPGIYLGNHWVLTAVHTNSIGQFNTGGGEFPLIPNSSITLTNSVSGGSSSDLVLYRVGVHYDDDGNAYSPEDLNPDIKQIKIADALPSTSETLTMFGRGHYREFSSILQTDEGTQTVTGQQYYFDSNGTPVSIQNPESGDFTYSGYELTTISSSNRFWQWGQNTPSTGQLTLNLNGRSTYTFRTEFDASGVDYEAQASNGDSGGPVLFEQDGEYILAGVMHAIYSASSSSSDSSLLSSFGAQTAVSNLANSAYYTQLRDLRGIPGDSTYNGVAEYSMIGDIDLDGEVDGELVAGEATGDFGILVDNWLVEFETADIKSWIKGDLNQDAVVDLADFALMRDALGGTITTSDLAFAIGIAVPEPGAALLVLTVIAASASRRR